MDLETVRAAIAEEQAEIARLERERAAAMARLQGLQKTLQSLGSSAQAKRSLALPALEKVGLFRSLFRGQEDVFPRLWINAKTGRKGYSPACSNEWSPGICGKPKVKCGECPSQAFVPVRERITLDHLQGRHVIGVYPLLPDETCWFLAVDFDKRSWAEDVAAFMETCRSIGIPAAVERSRSGNGAHVWFFFSQPVVASAARKMGCYLITETMARRHELSMESYDRLFPNQDTIPKGGFGNLIALPLQHAPRQQGNTVFLDEQLQPYPDQWAYLASLSQIEPSTVEAIAMEAVRQDRVIGVRMALVEDEEEKPWTKPPSGRRQSDLGPPPEEVRAILAQRLFIDKAALPPAFLNQIKRLAAFQNPEFYKKQSMRLSTATTPRVITCAEELSHHIALPRGCLDDLKTLLNHPGCTLLLDDQRTHGEPLDFKFQGSLTPIQVQATQALLEHDMGIFVAPPGVGKTVVGTYLVAARARNILILVHRKPLLDQWIAQLSLFLGVEAKQIGQIGGGKRRPNGRLDVAMIQSLVRNGTVDDIVANYGHVIVDECHHLPAISFERVLAEIKARYVTGLTATPYRRDGHQPIIYMQCGPVRFAADSRSPNSKRPFQHRLTVRETGFSAEGVDPKTGIQGLYAAIARDEQRNELIVEDVIQSLAEGRSPIVLTERRDHLEFFISRLQDRVHHLVILQGGMSAKDRRYVQEQLAAIPDDEERLVLATGRYIGEGFDDARLDTLFLGMPVSWKGTLVQYSGRLHRIHPGKAQVRIYDYVDSRVPMLARMFEKRLRGYRAIGYVQDEMPLGFKLDLKG
jgi:superfamily II DNA or RNA helicase